MGANEIKAYTADGHEVAIGDTLFDMTDGLHFTVRDIHAIVNSKSVAVVVSDEHFRCHDLSKCSHEGKPLTEAESAIEELALFLWQQTALSAEDAKAQAELFAERVRSES